MLDNKFISQVLDFLSTSRGERFTSLLGLAAHFNLTGAQFLEKAADKRIMDKLEINRAALKQKMNSNWIHSDKPQLQINAYRLMADNDELIRLSGDSPKTHELEKKDPLLEILQVDKIWGNK